MPATKSLIQKVTLTSNAAFIEFTNIPSTYTDLLLVTSLRTNRGVGDADDTKVEFNGSTSNLSSRILFGQGNSGVGSSSSATLIFGPVCPITGSTPNTFGSGEIYIPNYAGNTNKSVSITSAMETNDALAFIYATAGLWSNTAAITSIKLVSNSASNFVIGSSAFLYGVQASPNTPILAQGTQTLTSTAVTISNYNAALTYTATSSAGIASVSGNTVTVSGLAAPYQITTSVTASDSSGYSSSASLISYSQIEIEYLTIAGGGAGGAAGGGGGAGGYLTSSVYVNRNSPIILTVGSGGAGSTNEAQRGGSGSNSIFSLPSQIISVGGGGGGGNNGPRSGATGGSGGGGVSTAANGGTGGSGTTGQGFSGGTGNDSTGAGGGGAGQAGSNATTINFGGKGGDGLSSSITGSSITRAGGGGGIGRSGGGTGAGGSGGGGTGIIITNPLIAGGNGTANTGSGGGGGYPGGNGGSGVIILKIPNANSATFSGGVSQTNTTSGSFKIYTITAAGASDTVTFT